MNSWVLINTACNGSLRTSFTTLALTCRHTCAYGFNYFYVDKMTENYRVERRLWLMCVSLLQHTDREIDSLAGQSREVHRPHTSTWRPWDDEIYQERATDRLRRRRRLGHLLHVSLRDQEAHHCTEGGSHLMRFHWHFAQGRLPDWKGLNNALDKSLPVAKFRLRSCQMQGRWW